DTSNGNLWYITDRLGSVIDLVTAQGNPDGRLRYSSFGALVLPTELFIGDRYTYTGREYDSDTGLQYNRARWYDRANGSWISQDPVGCGAGDSNLYRYVGNSPTNRTDASGLWAGIDDLAFLVGGALVGVVGQGISDLIHWKRPDWEEYVGAAVGGAVFAETTL